MPNRQATIPKNWQQKQFMDCVDLDSLKKLKGLQKSAYKKQGAFPILDQAKDLISGYTDEQNFVYDNFPVILFGDHTRVIKYIDFPYAVGADGTKVFKSTKDVNTKFLYYCLLNTDIPNTGYNRHFKWLKKLIINLPPPPEQQKNAEILETVDLEIEKVSEEIEKSEEMKRGLMKEFFSEKVKVKNEKLGNFVNHVGSGATPRGGSKVYRSAGIPFIRSQNVHFDGLRKEEMTFVSKETHNKMQRSFVYPKDVLLNITGASIGRTCITPDSIPIANVNQHVCIIRPDNKLFYKYLHYFLQSKQGQNQIFKLQVGGNREGLNYQQIRSFKIPIIEIGKQKQIAEILSTVDVKIQITKNLKDNLTKLKKGLMQDLLSGVVGV